MRNKVFSQALAISFVIVTASKAQGPPVSVTGMLEYVSATALVVRLEDKREIQLRIPPGMQGLQQGSETGDLVDVIFHAITPVLDKELKWLLYAEVTEIHSFRKPSALELESALASPIRKRGGNLLGPTAPLATPEESRNGDDQFALVRKKVNEYLSRATQYIADETTSRFAGVETPEAIDVIKDEIRFDGRQEIRDNITRNGNRWRSPYETLPGMKWRSAFTAKIRAVFSNPEKVVFAEAGSAMMNGHSVDVYSFQAPADSISYWRLDYEGFWPAIAGTAWISKEDRKVLQLETNSTVFPPDFAIAKVTERISFDYVTVGDSREVLPISSEAIWIKRDGKTLINQSKFSNYRNLASESGLTQISERSTQNQ